MVQYCLRRVSHFWGYKEDNEPKYIYYMLAPPWVKVVINDAVNATAQQKKGLDQSDSFRFALAQEKKPILYSKEI